MKISAKKEQALMLKARLFHAATVLFVRNGFSRTTVEEISSFVGETRNNAFYRSFGNKENALLELMPYALERQFGLAEKLMGGRVSDKVIAYAINTAVEYYVAEESDALRDLYVSAYSLPETASLIYKMMAPKLLDLFGEYLPGYAEKDFYELDIATSGIVRGYLSVPCDMYFTLPQKIRKSVEATLRIFRIPEEKICEAVKTVLSMDMTEDVREAIEQLILSLEKNDVPESANKKSSPETKKSHKMCERKRA